MNKQSIAKAPPFGTAKRPISTSDGRLRSSLNTLGYAENATAVAAILMIMLAVRFTEIIPGAAVIRPVALTALAAMVYLLSGTASAVQKRVLKDPVSIALFAYATIAVVGVPFALMRSLAFKNLLAMLFGIVLTLSLMVVPPTLRALDSVARSTVLGASFVSVHWLALGQSKGQGRLTSTGSYDPNDLAAMMCMLLPLAIAMIFRGRWMMRAAGVLSAIVFLSVIILTSSRGGLVGLGVMSIAALLSLRPQKALLALAIAAPLSIGAWNVAPTQFKERAASLVNIGEDYNVTTPTGRLAIWKRGIMHFAENPIIGVGMGNYQVAEGNYFSSTNTVAAYFTAHNTYIQAFVEFGVFGGLVLMYLVYSSILATWRAARWKSIHMRRGIYRPEYFVSCVGYFTAALFLSHAFVYLLFGMIGLATLVRRVNAGLRS